jgi:hypothetical protein
MYIFTRFESVKKYVFPAIYCHAAVLIVAMFLTGRRRQENSFCLNGLMQK